MTIVEAWASDEDRHNLSVYTQEGKPLPAQTWAQEKLGAEPGQLLLGRFLCDGELGLSEELGLLRHLRERYKTDAAQEALREAVSCLIGSSFLTTPVVLLHRLATLTPDSDGVLKQARERGPVQFTRIMRTRILDRILAREDPARARGARGPLTLLRG
jgi:hypothetical protein